MTLCLRPNCYIKFSKNLLEEENPTLVQKDGKEEYEIILDLEEKYDESKPIIEVVLPIILLAYSYHQRSSISILDKHE